MANSRHPLRHFRSGVFSFILDLAVTKRKPSRLTTPATKTGGRRPRFSAAKAVKANARERVGQPKPERVIDEKPRTGRAAKHKPKLEDLVGGEE